MVSIYELEFIEKNKDAAEMAKKIFDECNKDNNERLTGKEFWTCVRALRKDIWHTTMSNLKWDMKHSHMTTRTIWRGVKKYGKTNWSKGVKQEDI